MATRFFLVQVMTYYCIFLISCTGSKSSELDNKWIQGNLGSRVDSVLTPYVETLLNRTDNDAGIAIGITKGDQIAYARTFGLARVQDSISVDLNTIFHIASLSKPFTAMAIAKLVELGKIDFDDPFVRYVPEFVMKGESYREITIRQILNHSSGIPRHISSEDWGHPTYGVDALESNLSYAKEFELDFEPGSQYAYSNSAYDLIGLVIERVSGQPFAEFVKRQLLDPIGMHHTEYYKSPDALPEHWAAPHLYGLATQEWSPYPYTENYFPSSGVQSSLLDMCKWGILHVNRGTVHQHEVISTPIFEEVVSPQIETPWGDQMGLGWFLQSYLNRPIIMHTGLDPGFEAMMYIYPEEDISIVILANSDFGRAGRLVNATSEVVFGETPKSYQTSAQFSFAKAYQKGGIEHAKKVWEQLRLDTTDQLFHRNGDLLSMGAVLENGEKWSEAKDILEYYMTLNDQSTYAWRLLGNAYANTQDTTRAIACYRRTLQINPNYEKGRKALTAILQ